MTSALTFEGGWSARRMRDQGYAFRYLNNPPRVLQQDTHRGTGLRNGGYVQQSWAPTRRVRLTAGARWDTHDFSAESAVSPNAAVSIGVPGGVDVHLGWGQYVQFPELRCGRPHSGVRGCCRSAQITSQSRWRSVWERLRGCEWKDES